MPTTTPQDQPQPEWTPATAPEWAQGLYDGIPAKLTATLELHTPQGTYTIDKIERQDGTNTWFAYDTDQEHINPWGYDTEEAAKADVAAQI